MVKKTLRIGLFLPAGTSFYTAVFEGMKRGFEQLGHLVAGGPGLLDEANLVRFCEQFKPDFIFEMNRSKNQIQMLPRPVKHIAWVVDSMGRDLNDFYGSDIVYLFGYASWLGAYNHKTGDFVDWLAPGFCPNNYYHKQKRSLSDFSFVGHIPLPWNEDELNRIVSHGAGVSLIFDEFFDHYCQRWTPRLKDSFELAQMIIHDTTGENSEVPAGVLRYDIACRSSRMVQRTRLVNMMLEVSTSLRLYGPENWKVWPDYAQFYQKYLTSPSDICEIYQTSMINFHEGIGPHFRLFDCMGAGGLLFCAGGPDRDVYGELNYYFIPGEHYIPFEQDNFSELARYYLAHEKQRQIIALKASERVHGEHTWRHRAEKICEDFFKL
jgi:hypothetical protein